MADQAGASNWITASKVMEAAELIETGEIYAASTSMGCPWGKGPTRSPSPAPPGGPFPGGLIYHDEFIVGELGQVGTQFDGLGQSGWYRR